MKQTKSILLGLLFLLMAVGIADAMDCPACNATDLPGLAMSCPECNANIHDPTLAVNAQKHASLRIRLLYTGNNPDRLPTYGKLFINGKYYGNIDMVEKQAPCEEFATNWHDGLGKEFNAIYEKILDKVTPGILKIEVEMKFDRLYGYGRSFKRVIFPYVSFAAGEKTTIEHYFNSAATFHQYKPGKRLPIPVVSDAKIQGASGTIALNIGLFK